MQIMLSMSGSGSVMRIKLGDFFMISLVLL